jgi:hypothetical protein
MYWLGPWREELESLECEEAVKRVNGAFTQGRAGSALVLEYRGRETELPVSPKEKDTRDQVERLVVFKVERRRLPFYPAGWWLYRFACDIAQRSDLSGYEREAFVFCVARVPPKATAGAIEEITPLDWTSPPIHRLNDELALDLGRCDDETVREYLIFFTSFIGAEGNESDTQVNPFALPANVQAISWSDELDLETVAVRKSLELFPSLPLSDKPDPFDFPEPKAESAAESGTRRYSDQEKRDAVTKAFTTLGSNPEVMPSDDKDGANGEKQSIKPPKRFRALVWYGDALYDAQFSVFKTGVVVMDDDQPLAGGQDLPLSRWIVEVRWLLSGVRILCHQAARSKLENHQLIHDLKESGSAEGTASNVLWRHCRINGDVRFPSSLPGLVEFDDVEFTGPVILDDCVVERSLEFRRCVFLQSVSLKNATIKGSLVLRDSRIEGALPYDPQQASKRPPEPALALDGLTVDRGLHADGLTVQGTLSGQSMRIEGGFQARGLRANRRRYRDGVQLDSVQVAFDHSRISGPLDLRSDSEAGFRPGARMRTRLGGNVSLKGLVADAVMMSGVRIEGELDLSSARCTGTLELAVAWWSADRSGTAASAWRTQVEGSLHLFRAGAHMLHLAGCYVKNDLFLVETAVSTSVYAEFDSGFQCRIGRILNASGAAVNGDIDLTGIRIDKELHMITGRCARIRTGPGIWFNEVRGAKLKPRFEPKLAPARVGGLFLASVTLGADVSLIAIQVQGGAGGYAKGGIIARGVRLGGKFLLWEPNVPEVLEQSIRDLYDAATGDSIRSAIESLRSSISGNVDLRGIRAGGTIDLSRAAIEGVVQLDNAQIEGDLRATDETVSTQCSSFEASLAKISGNADLRSLVVNGNLVAKGVEVRGSLLLSTPKGENARGEVDLVDDGSQAAVCHGLIQLEAVSASKLVLAAGNVVDQAREIGGRAEKGKAGRRAVISLARARVGHLEIGGFKRYFRWWRRFPVDIDLSRIEFGYWKINPHREVLPLLKGTQPFDRNVFIAVEERLAKLGYRGPAHKTWRRMVWRGAHENRWRYPALVVNGLFSRQGTWPLLMALWLLVTIGCVAFVLSDSRNVERTDPQGAQVDLEKTWNAARASALAFGYAVPLYPASRFEAARARMDGPSCAGGLLEPGRFPGRMLTVVGWRVHAEPAGSGSCGADGVLDIWGLRPSPSGVAEGMSVLQFVLWLLVAANVPAIIRRRN